MRLTFLGVSAGMPTKDRNAPALALQFEQQTGWWMFDCGEGTQRQLLSTGCSPARLERIFLTHLHGDHCLGLFGLLASRSLNKITDPVTVTGPKGIGEMLECVWRNTGAHLQFGVKVEDVPLEPVDLGVATITAVPVAHNIPCYAYIVQEPDRPGRFLIEKARELNIPPGPYFGRLKAGETVVLPDGRKFDGTQFCEPPARGRKIVISGDNRSPELLIPHLADTDLLVHEATFTQGMLEARNDAQGEKYAHCTARQAAEAAHQAGVPNLILTHFSAGFSRARNKPFSLEQLLEEARSVYSGKCILARDFLGVEITRGGEMKLLQNDTKSFKS
jgi:ribonuclease Z